MKGELVTVYRNKLLHPVEMAKTLLENNGIVCFMRGVDKVQPDVMYATGIELQVQKDDKDKAIKLIKEVGL